MAPPVESLLGSAEENMVKKDPLAAFHKLLDGFFSFGTATKAPLEKKKKTKKLPKKEK